MADAAELPDELSACLATTLEAGGRKTLEWLRAGGRFPS